jgi:hypothetical protein
MGLSRKCEERECTKQVEEKHEVIKLENKMKNIKILVKMN